MTNEKILYIHFRSTYGHQTWQSATYGQKIQHTKSCYPLIKWSRDKCKTLYLHFGNIYDHQTWQSGNLRWRDPSFKGMCPFGYVVTWQKKKNYFCTSTIPMATKLGRVITYGQKTPYTKLHDLLITWSRGKWKKPKSTLTEYLWQSGNLHWGNPTH